jgi:hypothetical protein
MEGVYSWDTRDGVHVLRIHYTADPGKRSPEWKEQAMQATTQQDWAQEMEIDWTVVHGVPWYPEFSTDLHVSKQYLIPIPSAPVIAGIDYGLTPATVFIQTTAHGQILVHHPELQSWDSGIYRHGQLMKAAAQYFPNSTIHWYGDPAGNQRAQNDERTCVQELRESYGINVMNGPVAAAQRDIPIRKALTTLLHGGKPQLLIDPRCTWLIEALKGGYRRKQINDVVLDELDDNEYTHIVDALGYAVSRINYGGEQPLKGSLPKLGGYR